MAERTAIEYRTVASPFPSVRSSSRAEERLRRPEQSRSDGFVSPREFVVALKQLKPGPVHRNATGRGFEPAVARAGIDGVSFHSMRHAFASRMIARGISSTVLAALMGHESSTITERRYIHLFDRQRTDEAVRLAMSAAVPARM